MSNIFADYLMTMMRKKLDLTQFAFHWRYGLHPKVTRKIKRETNGTSSDGQILQIKGKY